MYIVAIAWAFVVLLMVLAEATSTQGTLLGAFFTLIFYGVLPLSIVLYVMGTPARRRRAQVGPATSPPETAVSADPDRGSVTPGDAVAPEGEEAGRL
jgi:hypothetical protein